MCESSAFVIIKGRGFLLEILMKDKQIKIEKTIFYMLLLMVMVYRGVILFKYSFYYVDDDQALMWYGTVSFAHFDFHEPCFLDSHMEA